jgi:hypothetical protein
MAASGTPETMEYNETIGRTFSSEKFLNDKTLYISFKELMTKRQGNSRLLLKQT